MPILPIVQQYLDTLINFERITYTTGSVDFITRSMQYNAYMRHSALHLLPSQTVIIAGTNGKGSTAHLLSSLLIQSGHSVGLFTSPHLVDTAERIQLNNIPIQEDDQEKIFPVVKQLFNDFARHNAYIPTYFEFMTAFAAAFFKSAEPDVIIWEAGLGGRWDAVNVFTADVLILTPIDKDHEAYLGKLRRSIAREKAALIRSSRCVISAPQHIIPRRIIKRACTKYTIPLHTYDKTLLHEHFQQTHRAYHLHTAPDKTVILPSIKNHTINLTLALQTLNTLYPKSITRLPVQLTLPAPPARLQILTTAPLTIVDGGHNPHAFLSNRTDLNEIFPDKKAIVIFSCMQDKKMTRLIQLLKPIMQECIIPDAVHPRQCDAHTIIDTVQRNGIPALHVNSLDDAYTHACKIVTPDTYILITGSFYTAGAMMIHHYGIMSPNR